MLLENNRSKFKIRANVSLNGEQLVASPAVEGHDVLDVCYSATLPINPITTNTIPIKTSFSEIFSLLFCFLTLKASENFKKANSGINAIDKTNNTLPKLSLIHI